MIGSLTLILLSWLVAVGCAAAPRVVVEAATEGGQKLEIELVFQLGAAEDPPGRSGLTHLSEHVALARGPAVIALEAAGGEVVGLTTHDLVRLRVVAPAGAPDLALGAVAAVLNSGESPINLESWAEERGRALTEALADRYSEPALRGLALYPPGHPYHRPAAGLPDELAQIRPSDASDWLREAMLPALDSAVLRGGPEGAAQALDALLVERTPPPPLPRATPPASPAAWPRAWWVESPRPAQLQSWALPPPDPTERAALDEIVSYLNDSILNKIAKTGPISRASAGLLARRLSVELVVRAEPQAHWRGRLLGLRVGPSALDHLQDRVARALSELARRRAPDDPVAVVVRARLRPEEAVTLSLGADRSHWPKMAEELPTR